MIRILAVFLVAVLILLLFNYDKKCIGDCRYCKYRGHCGRDNQRY